MMGGHLKSAHIHLRIRPEIKKLIAGRATAASLSITAYLITQATRDPGTLEDAVETVIAHLESVQREDLAAAVAVATDPIPEQRRAEVMAWLRTARRR